MKNLDIRVIYMENFSTPDTYSLQITLGNDDISFIVAPSTFYTITIGTLDTSTNTFPTIQDAITYYYPTDSAYIVSAMNIIAGSTIYQVGQRIDFLQTSTATLVNAKVDKTVTVNGHALSGNVTVSKGDVGLGNVDNTSDASKPISTAVTAALTSKLNIPTGSTSQVMLGDGSLASIPVVPSTTDSLAEGTTHLYYTDARAAASGGKGVSGTTVKTGYFPVIKSATVASGVAVFNFTTDGTSTGAALFANGPDMDSLQLSVNDATASYQMGWAWSNSNKTLTVTANKLTTANILTGLLGQTAANSAVVRVSCFGN